MPDYPAAKKTKPYEHPVGSKDGGGNAKRAKITEATGNADTNARLGSSRKNVDGDGAVPQVPAWMEKEIAEKAKQQKPMSGTDDGRDLAKKQGQGISDYTYQLWLLKKKQGGKLKKGDRERVRDQYMAEFDKAYNKLINPKPMLVERKPGSTRLAKKKKEEEQAEDVSTASDIEAGTASLVDFNKSAK
ncbi:MAG: hypothetical protein HY075_13950 [Deltaproteobacteria bacterium]|nr:hypothetical protein [Deltaproteobacteria bacterium]